MTTVNSVVCYGIRGRCLECLSAACARVKLGLLVVDRLCEVLEQPALLALVDPSSADEDELRCLMAAAAETPGVRLMLTGPVPVELPSGTLTLVDAPERWSEEALRCILLKIRKAAWAAGSRRRGYDRRIVRLVYILNALDLKRAISVDQIASRMDVSTRTAARDLQVLRLMGVPMHYDRASGEYRVPNGWNTDLI